jgi:hypothetical protein
MSLKQTAIEFLHLALPSDVERFRAEHRVVAAVHTPLSVMAGVATGGVAAGLPATDILICGLVAGTGVALFCAAAAWLFDAPMGPGLLGLWDDSGRLRPLRFRPPRHPGSPAPAHCAIRSRSTSKPRADTPPVERQTRRRGTSAEAESPATSRASE